MIKYQNYKHYLLPITMNPLDYGKLILKIDSLNLFILQINKTNVILLQQYSLFNSIKLFREGDFMFEYKDHKIDDSTFIRSLQNKKFTYKNNNLIELSKIRTLILSIFLIYIIFPENNSLALSLPLILKRDFSDNSKNYYKSHWNSIYFNVDNQIFSLELLSLVTPFISKLKNDKIEINNFITLDIETYGDTVLTPYLISFYDGVQSYSFYLSDFESVESMIKACFDKLFIRKYNKHSIYIHNLVKFDIIFLFKYLIKYVQVDPVIHRGRIIQLNINYGPDLQYKMSLKDSYLILLSSLEKLGVDFGVEIKKSVFPHKFVNENNLTYIGHVPSIDNFFKIDNLTYYDFSKYFGGLWSLKSEAIKYCETDCISLYQIILKFNFLIFSNFNKNIHNYPTLPSLAFAIFRGSFMIEENIPILRGNIDKDIRQGYTGGSTDMFIPYGTNLKCYDVNSLYPSVMINKDMPIGKAEKFIGDITKFESNPFGFFYVKVNCPDNIMHPIIQVKYKTKGGIKTISPLGTWSMWIFSEEMYNAIKYGYTFEILEGYKFERGVIFKNYVEFLFSLRQQYDKSNPLNLIAKILLNSLYGRFGMHEINLKYEIISKKDFDKIENKENIIDSIEIDDHVLFGLNYEAEENNSNNSIGVATAITAYARIHMSKFKINPLIRLYYTDTDSIFTDSDLESSFIDPKMLGKLKLEYFCEEAVFLGPKTYCLKTKNGLITKVKGLKDPSSLTLQDFKDLLVKDTKIEQNHKKWFRQISEGKITIKDQIYTLIATDNKREFIYKNNKIIGTKAITLND